MSLSEQCKAAQLVHAHQSNLGSICRLVTASTVDDVRKWLPTVLPKEQVGCQGEQCQIVAYNIVSLKERDAA
jgi:hypothetical protein